MEFLFKDRGSGKRAIKPSKEAEVLEAMIPDHESDDSDFELDKHGEGDSDNDSDDDKSQSGSDNGGGSDSGSGDSDSDEVDDDEIMRLKSNLTTEELISLARRQTQVNKEDGTSSRPMVKVCGCCLGTQSDHTNEMVECDGCGLSVHEACYGITEAGSVASNASSACTEPWFCDVCLAGLTSSPSCELCPNKGGIYKETDTGAWVHLICALYTPCVSFFDQERLSRPTLFELNYQSWGRRACALCRDIKMARTGVVIECDAGMCKSYFHVTCAQEAGLLSEPSEDDHEQFFGHCKAHSDREQIKRRRKNWATHQINYRQRGAIIMAEREADKQLEPGVKETPSQRNWRKLSESRARWLKAKSVSDHWMPTQKMSRLLLTSSKAIKKLQRKAELHEWNVEAMEEEEANKQVVADIRKKWHVAPALTVEYFAYYHDRATRLKEMQENLAEAMNVNTRLKEEDEATVAKYKDLVAETDADSMAGLKKIYKLYKDVLVKYDPLCRGLKSPSRSKTPTVLKQQPPSGSRTGARSGSTTSSTSVTASSMEVRTCHLCGATNDQHLMAYCDICKHSYHIHCLTPPLDKMPRKTKQYGWQCSECDRGDPSVQISNLAPPQAIDLEAPRASRTRGQPSRVNSIILSDSEADSVRNNSNDLEPVIVTPSRKNETKKTQPKSKAPVESTPSTSQPSDISATPQTPQTLKSPVSSSVLHSSSSQAPPSTPSPATHPTPALASSASILTPTAAAKPSSTSTPASSGTPGTPATPASQVKTPKKRGRPVGWRKDPSKIDPDSPAAKKAKERKPKSSKKLPAVTNNGDTLNCVTLREPNDGVFSPSKVSDDNKREANVSPNKQPPDDIPHNLPPKKFFKSKAAQKENDQETEARVSPPPNPENERTNFRKWLDDKLSPIKGVTSLNAEPPVTNGTEFEDKHSRSMASDDSSIDDSELSPDKNGSITPEAEGKEARKERKRLKREEKEKRREERRKKKLLKSQESLVCNIVEERPEIEEDEDSCVVRIAPKSIKIKIKPLTKPDGSPGKAPGNSVEGQAQGDTNNIRERSLSPVTNMHPKKKLAHMTDSLVNNFPVVNNLIHSTLPFLQPLPMSENLQNINNKFSPLPPLPLMSNKKPDHHGNVLVTRNGVDHNSTPVDDYEFKDEETNNSLQKSTPPARPKRQNNENNSGKKGRDVRTRCDVCQGEGTNANLVRCDECLKCYHFGCLNPPVKKTPKVSGWAWSCSECAPSDEDKGWHL